MSEIIEKNELETIAKVQKVDLAEVEKLKDEEELFNYIKDLKNDINFLNNCKKYTRMKNAEK